MERVITVLMICPLGQSIFTKPHPLGMQKPLLSFPELLPTDGFSFRPRRCL
jgi:hypothetical protein